MAGYPLGLTRLANGQVIYCTDGRISTDGVDYIISGPGLIQLQGATSRPIVYAEPGGYQSYTPAGPGVYPPSGGYSPAPGYCSGSMASSAAVLSLVGPSVVEPSGATRSVVLPADGILGIYFSAHWCPPCRAFTPQLAEFYRKFKRTAAGRRLEIVFASSDRDQAQFNEYHAQMPWPALPYSDRARKEALSRRFAVTGIPTLVLVSSDTGEVITDEGWHRVMEDPEGQRFPWPKYRYH